MAKDEITSQNIDWLNGIAVFIDDAIDDETSNAYKLKQQIDKKNIPVLTRSNLPDDFETFSSHIHSASFVILDWKFSNISGEAVVAGVNIPEAVRKSNEGEIIDFIKKLLNNTYCPIFIFSDEVISEIKDSLDLAGITHTGDHPRIFITSKTELLDEKLFEKINDRLKENAIVYTLKTWEKAANIAKKKMFSTLESKHVSWPTVLWKTYESDHTNQSQELSKILTNIFSNYLLSNCLFSSDYFDPNKASVSIEDIKDVLEAERFMTIDNETPPSPGDLFEILDGEKIFYLLNIRAQCNLLHITSPDLYCIRGTILDENRIIRNQQRNNDDDILFFQGQLHGREDAIYIPFVHNRKIIEFDLKQMKVKKYDSSFRAKRIGRILPPYITRIQQIVSAYIIREGLPAIPNDILATPEK